MIVDLIYDRMAGVEYNPKDAYEYIQGFCVPDLIKAFKEENEKQIRKELIRIVEFTLNEDSGGKVSECPKHIKDFIMTNKWSCKMRTYWWCYWDNYMGTGSVYEIVLPDMTDAEQLKWEKENRKVLYRKKSDAEWTLAVHYAD